MMIVKRGYDRNIYRSIKEERSYLMENVNKIYQDEEI